MADTCSALSSARVPHGTSLPCHGPLPASGGWGERPCVRPDRKVGVQLNSPNTYCRTSEQELLAREVLSRRGASAGGMTGPGVPRMRGVWGPTCWGPASRSLCRLSLRACGSHDVVWVWSLLWGEGHQPLLRVCKSWGHWAWRGAAGCLEIVGCGPMRQGPDSAGSA